MSQDVQLARGRARAYELLGDLLLRGLVEDNLEIVLALPELHDGLAPWRGEDGRIDLDEAGAAHYALFSLDVFPFGSVFLSTDAHPGGAHSRHASDVYAPMGFEVPRDAAPDHLGVELTALALASDAEAHALESGREKPARAARETSRRIIDELVVPHLPMQAWVISEHDSPFFRAVVEMIVELVDTHRASLGGPADVPSPAREPGLAELLDEAHTGLRDIAEYLLTPARSGLYLSRSMITALGRSRRVPRGFGSRAQTLQNLLQGASQYSELEALVSGFEALAESGLTYMEQWSRVRSPAVASGALGWARRMEDTRAGLRQLAEAAQVESCSATL